MTNSSNSSAPTMKMCRFIDVTMPPCHGPPRWNLESDDGNSFVTCDVHLAEGIRRSGLPAFIEAPKEPQSVLSVRLSSVPPLPANSRVPVIT
jgi:hypothetical protein